jgi:hypothetical protein
MADDVAIKFTTDLSALLSGMQQAQDAVTSTAGLMRNGATQIASSFGALSAAYANGATANVRSAASASAQVVGIAQEQENARYQIAMNGVKMNQALVKEEAQTSQLSHEQERAQLLALEDEREAIERRHLQSQLANAKEGSKAQEAAQSKLDALASQSALRREQIELTYNKQVYNDYKRTFDQIGGAVSSSIMGMIEGHETLRQAAQKVLLSILQNFIQTRIRAAADWAAGVAMQVTTQQAGETQKTAAVVNGVAARTAAESTGSASSLAASIGTMTTQIGADAGTAAAGVAAFLSPIMGPAALGAAAAIEGAVLGFAHFDVGSWQLPADQLAMVHQGEMIVPAAQTPWAQSLMSNAAASSGGGDTHYHTHNWGVTVNRPVSGDDVVSAVRDRAHDVGRALSRGMGSRGLPRGR